MQFNADPVKCTQKYKEHQKRPSHGKYMDWQKERRPRKKLNWACERAVLCIELTKMTEHTVKGDQASENEEVASSQLVCSVTVLACTLHLLQL